VLPFKTRTPASKKKEEEEEAMDSVPFSLLASFSLPCHTLINLPFFC
jgi:hypothetical protein